MEKHQPKEPTISALATTAVRLGRAAVDEVRTVWFGSDTREGRAVAEMFRDLDGRNPFPTHHDAALETLHGFLEAEIASEVSGTEWRVVETHYDYDGQQYERREVTIYTARGDRLCSVRCLLESFEEARNAALDRLAAERAILHLMTP